MDILSGLANVLGQSAQQPQSRNNTNSLGGLGGLISMLGGASGNSAGRSASTQDPLSGLGSLVGAILGNRGAGSATGASMGGAGALGGLLGSLMSNGGGEMLGRLLAGSKPPPAPKAGQDIDENRSINLLRALVYAARADGNVDEREQIAINRHLQETGADPRVQRMVTQFMNEDMDPATIAHNITSPEEALQIYAMSCALTGRDQIMERNYLDALANALGIPASAKEAIERKIAG